MSEAEATANERPAPSADAARALAPNERITLAHESPMRLAPLGFEPARRLVVHDDGREEIVEPRVMQVLIALVRAGGQVVTRDDLMMSCWHGVVVGEDAINRVMGRVRRLADGIGDGAIKLETITKVGYRLVGPGRATETPSTQPAVKRVSICVLPFANMSDDPQQEYFSDGGQRGHHHRSRQGVGAVGGRAQHGVHVQGPGDRRAPARAPTECWPCARGQRAQGRRTGADYRPADRRVAGRSHLVRTVGSGPDRHLRPAQDEISQAIVGALKLRLLPEEKASIERRGTENVDAYNLYLMARQFLFHGNHGDTRANEAIRRLCLRATQIDPGYARAWALLALAETSLHFVDGSPEDGREAAEKALSLDPDLAEARAVRARHLFRRGRQDEAAVEIGIALRLDPESYEVNSTAALLLYRRRDFAAAAGYYERATALVETAFTTVGLLIGCYAALGDKRDGAWSGRRKRPSKARPPGFWNRTRATDRR